MEAPHLAVEDEVNDDTLERPLPDKHRQAGVLATLRRRWPDLDWPPETNSSSLSS